MTVARLDRMTALRHRTLDLALAQERRLPVLSSNLADLPPLSWTVR